MANYITASGFKDITGITGEEIGELSHDTTIRDARITEAQVEFEKAVNKTFDGTEDDYAIAQRAVAYLTAHKLRLRKIELSPATPESVANLSSPFLQEYKRLLKLLRSGESAMDDGGGRLFDPGFETTEIENRYSADSDDTFDDKG